MPDTDDVIRVTREKSGDISTPCKRQTFGIRVLSLTQLSEFRAKFVNNGLGFEIPDLDTVSCGSTKPVAVRRESKSVDRSIGFERVKVLGIAKIPEHDNTILTGRSTERTIRRDSDCVDITIVTNEVGTKLQLGKVPNLDDLVPTTRDDERSSRVRREADTRDPFGVTIFGDVVLALTKGIPELDGLVTRTGNDLTVIGRERDRENIVSVTNETTSGLSGVQVPETKSVIPRGRQSKLTIRRDGNVFNKVGVTNEGLTRNTIVDFISNYVSIVHFSSIFNPHVYTW